MKTWILAIWDVLKKPCPSLYILFAMLVAYTLFTRAAGVAADVIALHLGVQDPLGVAYLAVVLGALLGFWISYLFVVRGQRKIIKGQQDLLVCRTGNAESNIRIWERN